MDFESTPRAGVRGDGNMFFGRFYQESPASQIASHSLMKSSENTVKTTHGVYIKRGQDKRLKGSHLSDPNDCMADCPVAQDRSTVF